MTKGQNLKLKRRTLAKESKKAAASATSGGEQGNRRKKGNSQFISTFDICENHSPGERATTREVRFPFRPLGVSMVPR